MTFYYIFFSEIGVTVFSFIHRLTPTVAKMTAHERPSLYVTIPGFQTTVRLATYNVDQAMREERHEATKWVNRMDRVTALIKEIDADICCLQEMRQLPNSPTINSWLGKFENYFFELGYRNPSTLSFGQAILYNPTKFYAHRTIKRWLSDTPHEVSDTWATNAGGTTGFGYLVLGTRFLPVVDGKIVSNGNPFWVFNVHFGLEEELKTKSCRKLLEIIRDVSCGQSLTFDRRERFIVAGDFNLFPDRDAAKQRAILESELRDLGRGAVTLTGRAVEGTFVGYAHDEFKADLSNMVSRLDNVFATDEVIREGQPLLYTKTMLDQEPEELTTRDYPSDHLPVVVSLRIEKESV